MLKGIGGVGIAPKISRELIGRDRVELLENLAGAIRLLKAGNASRLQQPQLLVVLRVLGPFRLFEPIFAGVDHWD